MQIRKLRPLRAGDMKRPGHNTLLVLVERPDAFNDDKGDGNHQGIQMAVFALIFCLCNHYVEMKLGLCRTSAEDRKRKFVVDDITCDIWCVGLSCRGGLTRGD